MLDIVIGYQNLLDNIGQHISESKFKKEVFIEELGLTRATFYNKIKKRSFTVTEMIKLSKLLFPEEVKAYEIREALKRSREQSKNGEVIDHDKVIANSRKKYKR